MALITDFISDPKSWCDCTLKASPQTVWLNEALEPIINDFGTVTSVTITPDTNFLTDYDYLYSFKHFTTGTDTITINTDNLPANTITTMKANVLRSSHIDRNGNTVTIDAIKNAIEKSNKESEDKKVTKAKKQPRMIYNANTYGKGFRTIRYGINMESSVYIMPEISDVRHIINKGDVIGVEIKFADNTKQKAICSPNDTFNLEQGISICLFKKILEDGFGNIYKGRGTSIYNKLVNHALKVMERRIKAEEKAKKEEAKKKEKEQRFIEKKRRADERRAKRESEQRINEMAEAIRRSGVVPTNLTDDGK